MLDALLSLLLVCAPARADTRVRLAPLPLDLPAPLAPQAKLPVLSPTGLTDFRLEIPAMPVATIKIDIPAAPTAQALPEKLAIIGQGVAGAVQTLEQPGGTDDGARSAGDGINRLLSGEKAAAESGAVEAPAAPALEREAAASVAAVQSLARAADDLGAEQGLKISRMTGAQFIGLVEQARETEDARDGSPASRAVRDGLVRVVKALVPAGKPMLESAPRLFAVWQVFGQEMARAASKGAAAVAEDAALFASQVEASVAPAPAPSPAPAAVHPEDPEGMAASAVPGSVFGWRPIEESPGHGFAPFDWAIRRALGPKTSPYQAGFEIKGAPERAPARVFFYGERHTDGGLIAANMKRIVGDAKPGKPMLVLVEGHTGWEMEGHAAYEYLAKRGMDLEALMARRVASVIVRGWDTIDGYGASKHPLLQHHMDLLELNRLAFSELRGARYYRAVLAAAWTAVKGWLELWKLAITARNLDLDRAVAAAVREADETGATVHVIAGSDHLMETPRLNELRGRVLRPSFRKSLKASLGGRPFWASQPAGSLEAGD